METIVRFFNPPSGSFFLFGPRGTGKSSWTATAFPQALKLDLLDSATFRVYSSRPELLREWIDGRPGTRDIIIDEIQKAPGLLPEVHRLIEERKALRFILTGSSARKLRRAGEDLLGGRAAWKNLHPFMAAELGERFSLERALQYGLLPLVWASPDPGETLGAYHGVYLREEVQMEALTRSVGAFARFLEAAAFSQGSPLNMANVARDCEVERKTVEGYFSIVEDLLLGFRLPVFGKRARRKLAGHPKFYFFDAGVFRSLRPKGPLDRPAEIDGAALETLVVQHLRAWNSGRNEANTLDYWRTLSGVEVDCVLHGPDGLWGIEVKNAAKVRPEDLRGLSAFQQDYPEAKTLLLYRGIQRLKKGTVLCLPVSEFLTGLHPRRPLEAAWTP